jgi:hypothetical protein
MRLPDTSMLGSRPLLERFNQLVSDPQAVVLMMLPSALVKPLAELKVVEVEPPPRFASSLSTNDEMIDCAEAALVEAVVPEDDVVPDVVEVLPVRLLSRF